MPESTPPVLFTDVHAFDAEARAFRSGFSVICDEGRIRWVGPGEPPDIPPGTRRLDGGGRYLIPGLIDCHVHLTSSGDPGELAASRSEPLALRALRAREYALQTVRAGVTTVRDLGAADHLNIHLAAAVESGLIDGPRILAAGCGVTMTGGHGHGFIAVEADGPDEVRKRVREQLRAGARAIKLFASGGVMTPGVDPRSASFTLEELRAGVEEAHKAFRVVAAHAQATEGIKNAILAGVDSIEHGVWLDEEAIGLMLERGTYLVPTLTAPWQIAHGEGATSVPPYMLEKSHQVLEAHQESFRAAVRAGVRIAMGTDQGTPFNRPGENAQELVRMAAQGLSNAAALLAATAWAADLLRISDRTGRLLPGLDADLVLLDADPLADLSVLTCPEAIRVVLRGGKMIRHELPPPEGP
ncbi:amidohydrolase family protein [Tepidiforma sp.]|uniref:metal-dependent hydrolase family protein n=1 Tax=Tepidiforma sp. TaxID=2682230 RepID=UPI002ADD8826|nr:amidohydrolase family protein [Tepidiforma sp.]